MAEITTGIGVSIKDKAGNMFYIQGVNYAEFKKQVDDLLGEAAGPAFLTGILGQMLEPYIKLTGPAPLPAESAPVTSPTEIIAQVFPGATVEPNTTPQEEPKASDKQVWLIKKRGGGEGAAKLKAAEIVGHAVPSLEGLTMKEASAVIDVLLKK